MAARQSDSDPNDWRGIFYYFKEVSANIVKTGAKVATRLANEKISKKILNPTTHAD